MRIAVARVEKRFVYDFDGWRFSDRGVGFLRLHAPVERAFLEAAEKARTLRAWEADVLATARKAVRAGNSPQAVLGAVRGVLGREEGRPRTPHREALAVMVELESAREILRALQLADRELRPELKVDEDVRIELQARVRRWRMRGSGERSADEAELAWSRFGWEDERSRQPGFLAWALAYYRAHRWKGGPTLACYAAYVARLIRQPEHARNFFPTEEDLYSARATLDGKRRLLKRHSKAPAPDRASAKRADKTPS